MDKHALFEKVRSLKWHHKFEIVPGLVTDGAYDPAELFSMLGLPVRLDGKTLADIGASNGYFSFEARKRGAEVTAFDFRHSNVSGFALCQALNGLTDIEHVQANVLELGQESGQFDIVLFLGVLYHVADPFRALRNVLAMTREIAYIESYCIDNNINMADGSVRALSEVAPMLADVPIVQFMPDPRRNPKLNIYGDYSNFWGYSSCAVRLMIEDLGFRVTRCDVSGDRMLVEAVPARDPLSSSRERMAYGRIGDENSSLDSI